jgi:hypothetical protein
MHAGLRAADQVQPRGGGGAHGTRILSSSGCAIVARTCSFLGLYAAEGNELGARIGRMRWRGLFVVFAGHVKKAALVGSE